MQKILAEWRKYLAERKFGDALELVVQQNAWCKKNKPKDWKWGEKLWVDKCGGFVNKDGEYEANCANLERREKCPCSPFKCKTGEPALPSPARTAARKPSKPEEEKEIGFEKIKEKEAASFEKRKKILNALIKELIEKLVHDVGLGDRESFYRVLYTGPDGDDIESTLNPEKEGDPTYQAQQIINKHEYEQKVGEILKKHAIKIFSEPIWRSDFAKKRPEVMAKLKSVVQGRVLMIQSAKKWHSASYHGESTVPNWPTF